MNKVFRFFFILVFLFSASVFALSAPTISSSSHPNQDNWYNDDTIVLSWSSSGVSEFSYVLDSNPDTIPSVAAVSKTTVAFSNKAEGEYYFHVVAVSGSERSEAAHFRIKIDSSGPSKPGNIKGESLDDGTIKISWDASTDSGSGIGYYNVYRSVLRYVNNGAYLAEFTIRDAVAKLVGENISVTSFIDGNIADGRNYHYRVQPFDVSQNPGQVSSIVSVKSKSFCDITFEIVPFLSENDLLEVTAYANGSDMKYAKLYLIYPDSNEELIAQSPAQEKESLDANKSFHGFADGRYVFSIEALDSEGDSCFGEKEFFIDKENPAVSFIAPVVTSKLQEIVLLKVRVSDAMPSSGIEKVEFYVDLDGFKKIGESTEADANNGEDFVFSWDTLSVENGRFSLKAKVYDTVGNIGEATEIFTVFNTADLKMDVNNLYSEFESIESELAETKETLLFFNVNYSAVELLELQADSNISESKRIYDLGIDFEKSKKLALEAVRLLNAAKNRIKIEKRAPIAYSFKRSELEKIYSDAGLVSELRAESVKNISDFGFSRKLNLYKITDGNNSNYFALIEITLFNNSSGPVQVKLIESVPKKFASDYSVLSSDANIFMLKKDPEFYALLELASKKTFSFKYWLSKPIPIAKIEEISSSISEFESPSAIVSSDRVLKEGVFNKQTAFLDFTFLKSLAKKIITLNGMIDTGLGLIVFGAIALIVFGGILLLGGGVAVYFLFFKKKRGMR